MGEIQVETPAELTGRLEAGETMVWWFRPAGLQRDGRIKITALKVLVALGFVAAPFWAWADDWDYLVSLSGLHVEADLFSKGAFLKISFLWAFVSAIVTLFWDWLEYRVLGPPPDPPIYALTDRRALIFVEGAAKSFPLESIQFVETTDVQGDTGTVLFYHVWPEGTPDAHKLGFPHIPAPSRVAETLLSLRKKRRQALKRSQPQTSP